MIWAIVVFQNQLGHENNMCQSGQLLFLALIIAVWSIFFIWDCPTKSSKLSGLVARIVCFCVVVSIFFISTYDVKIFGKLNLRYYFFYKMQEKDFFDKKEKISKRLDVMSFVILNEVKRNEESYKSLLFYPEFFATFRMIKDFPSLIKDEEYEIM